MIHIGGSPFVDLVLVPSYSVCANYIIMVWVGTGQFDEFWEGCLQWTCLRPVTLKRVLNSVTLTFDLWLWPLAWTSLLSMVITLKISWWYDDQNIANKANLRDLIAATSLVILLRLDSNHWFFSPCDFKIWGKTSKNNRTPLFYYVKLCASFQILGWIQTWVTIWKRPFWVKIGNILSRVTLKFDGWPWRTIGRTMSSFVHHLKAMGEFKLELEPRNAQFGSKSMIFLSCVTLKFYWWPWKTLRHLLYTMSSFMHHFKAMGEFKLELQSGNAQFGSKSAIFCPMWPWNLMDDLEKQQGTFSILHVC